MQKQESKINANNNNNNNSLITEFHNFMAN